MSRIPHLAPPACRRWPIPARWTFAASFARSTGESRALPRPWRACIGATVYWLSYGNASLQRRRPDRDRGQPSSIVRVDQMVEDVISDSAEVNTEVAVLESRGLADAGHRDLELDRIPNSPRGGPGARWTRSLTARVHERRHAARRRPATRLISAIAEALNSAPFVPAERLGRPSTRRRARRPSRSMRCARRPSSRPKPRGPSSRRVARSLSRAISRSSPRTSRG